MKKLILSTLILTALSLGSSVWADIAGVDKRLNENLDNYMPVYKENRLSELTGQAVEFKIIDRVKVKPEPYYTSAGSWVGYAERGGAMLEVTYADRDPSGESSHIIDHEAKLGQIPLEPGKYTLEYTQEGTVYNSYLTVEIIIEEVQWPLKVKDSGFMRFLSEWENTPVYLIKYNMKISSRR